MFIVSANDAYAGVLSLGFFGIKDTKLIDSLTFLDFMQTFFFFSTKCSQIIRTVLSAAFEEQAGKGGVWLIEYAFDFSSLN